MSRSVRSRVRRDLVRDYVVGDKRVDEAINRVCLVRGWPDQCPGYTRPELYEAVKRHLLSELGRLQVRQIPETGKYFPVSGMNYQLMWEKFEKHLEKDTTATGKVLRATMNHIEDEERKRAEYAKEVEELCKFFDNPVAKGPFITEIGKGADGRTKLRFSDGSHYSTSVPIAEAQNLLRSRVNEWVDNLVGICGG